MIAMILMKILKKKIYRRCINIIIYKFKQELEYINDL